MKKLSHISFYNRSTRASCSKEVSRESRFDSLTDSWFPLDDIFNQEQRESERSFGEVVSGTSFGFSTSGTKVARDSQG